MQERVQKLLILAGQQSLELQSRDYKKVSESILGYLKQRNPVFNQFLINILSRVIKEVPLKYHLYAALTAQMTIQFSNLATTVIQQTLKNLQIELCRGDLYNIMNILEYLAELMSLSVFNSSTFMNILQDIIKSVESEKLDHPVRKILIISLARTLPIYAYSLNEKISHQFRKYLDKLKKLVFSPSEQEIFDKVYTDFTKNTIKDNSWIQRLDLKLQLSFQYHNNMKLQLQLNSEGVTHVPQYFTIILEDDELYQIFVKSQGLIHRNNIEQLIHTFKTNSHLLVMKIINYIKFFRRQNHYVPQYIIEILFGKALYDNLGLIQCYIINACCSQEHIGKDTKIIVNDILIHLYGQAQKFSLDILMEFSRVFSYLYNNSNLNWQWQPYLEPQTPMIQRQILLRITFQRIALLNDKKDLTEFSKYVPSDRKKITQYTTIQDMEIFEAFTSKLASKSQSDVIIPMIISEHTFEIFLQTLFRRTCLSQTHLQVLLDRYTEVFKTYEQYDWILIAKIRRFWRKSFFNRILYINEIIKRSFCSFESYVNYISKVGLEGAEAVQLKLQLNQINKSYKKMSNKV